MGKVETQRILVDSDIIIDHLRKQSETLKQLSAKYSIAISTVTLFELYYGIFKGSNSEGKVKQLLVNMQFLPLKNKEARQAAKLQTKLESRGNLLEVRDIFVAATALANDLRLATRNKKHFQRIPKLELVNF